MRYLKVIIQDRGRNGHPDTVLLDFYEQASGAADVLVHRAFALDLNADGWVDFQRGDANNDGEENLKDRRLLRLFANSMLKLNWFNTGELSERYVKIFSEGFSREGSPDTVHLHFHQGEGEPADRALYRAASAYDIDGDGIMDIILNNDVDNDGDQDAVDERRIALLSAAYLRFAWR